MNINTTLSIKICFLFSLILLLVSCTDNNFEFEKEFKQANEAYYGPNGNVAESALSAFVARSEENETVARKEKDIDYDSVLAMAWLQLASIHEINGNKSKNEDAMSRAVSYFDKIDSFARDAKYQRDKRKALIELLTQTENYQKPEWKKNAVNTVR